MTEKMLRHPRLNCKTEGCENEGLYVIKRTEERIGTYQIAMCEEHIEGYSFGGVVDSEKSIGTLPEVPNYEAYDPSEEPNCYEAWHCDHDLQSAF